MVFLLILIIGTACGFNFECPAQAEWRLKANVSCSSEDKYVCLFNILEKKYEDNCLGLDKSSIGSKLVFQPLFNIAECDIGRFQPIVFTTHGNTKCILLKSKCDEEGQIVYSNSSTRNDTACRCDYSKGYAFVSKPKHSCYCKPFEEDCSCFRVKCSKLSSDYQCINEGNITVKTKCQEMHPQVSNNTHKQTVQYIETNINKYSYAHHVAYIISFIIAVYVAIISISVLKYYVLEPLSSTTNDERQKDIHELFQREECGKHYFARVIFIGKNGVGKTSLMRRLLWGKKKKVSTIESTDGIEIVKCNINVKNGEWSKCNAIMLTAIDHDLARLIHQVYTETKVNVEAIGQNIEVRCKSSQDKIDEKEIDENRYNLGANNMNKKSSNIDDTSVVEIKRENENNSKYESGENITTEELDSSQVKAENNKFRNFGDNQIKSNENKIEPSLANDENIVQMTSSIMESCLQQNVNESQDMLAFCTLWDFAGQKDFYATHQVFLSKCAVFLLVTDSLEFSNTEKLWIDFNDTAQYVRFWFDAIHCYWSNTKEKRLDPPIIVVCTNEDKVKDLNKRQKRQDEFKQNLGKILKQQKKKEHLRNIYFVSNTDDDDIVFQEIRQDISRQAMDMNDWGKDCPLRWLLFQQVIGKLKDSNVPISTTTKLLKIAKHHSIGINSSKDFKLCLQYFHDIGTVIYFDEESLKDHVILDPKWLIDAFRCLVSDKIENIIQISDDWQTLRETGELTDELISRLFLKEPKLKFLENKTHLLEVMERFDIIVKLRNSAALYMPCMMESCSFGKIKKKFLNKSKSFNRTSWLCLEFEFLPPAFFNHILAWYINQYSVSVIIDKKTRTKRNALYRQIGVFDLDSSGCDQLVLCEGPNIIALQVWDSRMSCQTYIDLGNRLFQFIETILKRYSLQIPYTKSFKCKDGDFTINRKTIGELFTEEYRCLEHKTNHLTYDLVNPWIDNEELTMLKWQVMERLALRKIEEQTKKLSKSHPTLKEQIDKFEDDMFRYTRELEEEDL